MFTVIVTVKQIPTINGRAVQMVLFGTPRKSKITQAKAKRVNNWRSDNLLFAAITSGVLRYLTNTSMTKTTNRTFKSDNTVTAFTVSLV